MDLNTMQHNTAGYDRALTVKEAAAVLRVNPFTIRRYVADKRIRGTRVGPRRILVSAADVNALLAPLGA
jgi:excisionase family DNA binding protein